LNRELKLTYFIFPMLALAGVWTIALAAGVDGAPFSNDPLVGLFGWASAQWWWVGLYLTLGLGLVRRHAPLPPKRTRTYIHTEIERGRKMIVYAQTCADRRTD
jgi:hypothetical protein